MPLSEENIRYLNEVLDRCDDALADKPTLTSIYDEAWRRQFRTSLLAQHSMNDVNYPSTYSIPHFDMFNPPDYHDRVEEGTRILLAILSGPDRNHMIERFRGNGCLSAEEEALLARGFASEFGEAALQPPRGPKGVQKPEFAILADGHRINIEAKGLLDSALVRRLGENAIRSGEMCWYCTDADAIDRPDRVRASVLAKINQLPPGEPGIVVFTQYTAWPTPDETIQLLATLAIRPDEHGIAHDRRPLAIAGIFPRLVQGIWFNFDVAKQFRMSVTVCERLRSAIRNSFYPRCDGVFFQEGMSETEQRAMFDRMFGREAGGHAP